MSAPDWRASTASTASGENRAAKCGSCDFFGTSKVSRKESEFAPKLAARSDNLFPVSQRHTPRLLVENSSPRDRAERLDSESEFPFVPAPTSLWSKSSESVQKETSFQSEPKSPKTSNAGHDPRELSTPRSLIQDSIVEAQQHSEELAIQGMLKPVPEGDAEKPTAPLKAEEQHVERANAKARAIARLEALHVKYCQEDTMDSQHWIKSTFAELVSCAVILLQSINLGIEMEIILNSSDGKLEGTGFICLAVKIICILVFVVELGLRIRADGPANYFSIHKPFNIFDSCMVFLAAVDAVLSIAQARGPLAIASSLRLFRLWRVVCVNLELHRCPELQFVFYGTAKAFSIAFWSVLILAFACYCGSLLCADFFVRSDDPDLRHLFGSIPRSMLTHVKLALATDWFDISTPMLQYSGIWRYYVATFVFAANLLFLNVVTGVICEQICCTSSHVPPLSAEIWHREVETFRHNLQAYFEKDKIPRTLSGYVTLLRIEEVQDALRAFGIRFGKDEHHASFLLREHTRIAMEQKLKKPDQSEAFQKTPSIVNDETEIPFDCFFKALMRQRGAQTDCVSQELQYDIVRCDKMSARCVDDLRHQWHGHTRDCGARARDNLSGEIAKADAEVLATRGKDGPDAGDKESKVLTARMFNDKGVQFCTEFEEISRILKGTLTRAEGTLSQLRQEQESKVLDSVLDEKSPRINERLAMRRLLDARSPQPCLVEQTDSDQLPTDEDPIQIPKPSSSVRIPRRSALEKGSQLLPATQLISEHSRSSVLPTRRSRSFGSPSRSEPRTDFSSSSPRGGARPRSVDSLTIQKARMQRSSLASTLVARYGHLASRESSLAPWESLATQIAKPSSPAVSSKVTSPLETLPAPPPDENQGSSQLKLRDSYGRLSLPS